MPILYPLTFQPRFKDRVWGGRNLERLYAKPLPPKVVIGESWEITDRPGDASVIINGPLAGHDLRWLMQNHCAALLGNAKPQGKSFPLLIKILDAQQKLSLQVHPPANKAAQLGGEPKTEMWFIADAAPGAELYVGLQRGITRTDFESKLANGTVADCFHRIAVKAGDTMFLPSGRVHAIGAGLVIFEIQQNSDTTYRVFDWNRAGLDGKPRELHVAQSLESIDFTDFEPPLVSAKVHDLSNASIRELVNDPLFTVESWSMRSTDVVCWRKQRMQIIGVVSGTLTITSDAEVAPVALSAGQFCLVPAELRITELVAQPGSRFLRITCGSTE